MKKANIIMAMLFMVFTLSGISTVKAQLSSSIGADTYGDITVRLVGSEQYYPPFIDIICYVTYNNNVTLTKSLQPLGAGDEHTYEFSTNDGGTIHFIASSYLPEHWSINTAHRTYTFVAGEQFSKSFAYILSYNPFLDARLNPCAAD